MAGSGGSSTTNTTQNKDPWAPAQPHLTGIMSEGQRLYESGAGSQTWGGPLQANLDDNLRLGIQATQDAASRTLNNTPITAAPAGVLGNIASGANGISTGGQYANMANGPGISTGGAFQNVANQAGGQTSADQYLTSMASGADAGNNPHLMAMLDANAARIGNRVSSAMSGAGRYGSFAHGDALARSINETNLPLLAQSYESDKNRQLQATGMLDSARQGARGQQIAALTGQTGVEGQNINDRLRALAGQTGVESQNIANQGQAATGLLNFAPMMNELQYDAGNRLMGIGGMMTDRDQQLIDKQRGLFEQQQSKPWEMLSRYQGSVNMPLLQGMGTMTGNQQQENTMGIGQWLGMFGGGANSPMSGAANAGSAILGLLSDRNEKTDIKKLGTDKDTGLPVYSYRYRDDPKTYPKVVGPMAQDIEKKYPGSTGMLDGKMYVKPHAIGLLKVEAA